MLEKLLWMALGAAIFFLLQVVLVMREIARDRRELQQHIERSIWEE